MFRRFHPGRVDPSRAVGKSPTNTCPGGQTMDTERSVVKPTHATHYHLSFDNSIIAGQGKWAEPMEANWGGEAVKAKWSRQGRKTWNRVECCAVGLKDWRVQRMHTCEC